MDPSRLEDRLRWGLNRAARATGALTNAYRPSGPDNPLAPANRYLRLQATFSGIDGKLARSNGYGNPMWCGLFDAAYTSPGDYLVQGDDVWFIASQQRLLPVLCVKTNRVLSFTHPGSQASSGANAYGGITSANLTPLMTNWPASVLLESREGRPIGNLPSDTSVSFWSVLVPHVAGIVLRAGDLTSDDVGRSGTVTTSELTDFGWRLGVKQVTT